MQRALNFLVVCLLAVTIGAPGDGLAGEADVIDVKAVKAKPGVYSFRVTVRHGDTGWKHYANRWEVLDAKGNVLGTRVLLHPHVNEQPFARSLAGVEVPSGIKRVTLRAHDLVHGHGGAEVVVDLPR